MHPIFGAIASNDYTLFKELVQANPSILSNERDYINMDRDGSYWDEYPGKTPVHYAAYVGNLKFLKEMILIYKANHNIYDESALKEYFYPIHSAALGGHLPVVKFFLEEIGVDKNCKTALSFLIYLNNFYNIKKWKERSILDISVDGNHKNCIEYLFDIGVDYLENRLQDYLQNIYFAIKYVKKHLEMKEIVLQNIKFTGNYNYYLFCKEFNYEITTELKINAIKNLIENKKEEEFTIFLQKENLSTLEKEQIYNLALNFTTNNENYLIYLWDICNHFNFNKKDLQNFKIKNIFNALEFVKKDLNILNYCNEEILQSKPFCAEIYKENIKILNYVNYKIKNYIFEKFNIKPHCKLLELINNPSLSDLSITFNNNILLDNTSININSKKRNTNNKGNKRKEEDEETIMKERIDKKTIFISDIGFNITENDLLSFIRSYNYLIVQKKQVTIFIHEYKRFAKINFRKIEIVNDLLQKYENGIKLKGMLLKLEQCKEKPFKKRPVRKIQN
ncbi:hypothetical protein ABK040_013925 [Willaertia magna]